MRKILPCLLCLLVPTLVAARELPPIPLQAAYEAAGPEAGYDRYLHLETGRVYTGGLQIGPTWDEDATAYADDEQGLDVMIEGNGAVLLMDGEMICLSFCTNRLDVQDCVIVAGQVRFRGDNTPGGERIPVGSVRYCTFYRPHDFAVRLEGAGAGVTLERNIVVDPVDTGFDGLEWSGIPGENLPTGLAFGLSVQVGSFGYPTVRDNWTWLRDPVLNAVALRHHCLLCEYG